MTAGDLGETGIIEAIARRFSADPRVLLGPGDDAALLAPFAGNGVLTTDLMVEGTHFRREWMPADALGHKLLAVSLSDLAAMGARPVALLLEMAVPADWPVTELEAFADGLSRMAARHRVALAGGDTCASERLHFGLTLLGEVEEGKALTRSGGRPGDVLFVSGPLGASAAGLFLLEAGWRWSAGLAVAPPQGSADGVAVEDATAVIRSHLFPEPEMSVAAGLAGRATAALDLSDGMAADLPRLCRASGCGALLQPEALPVDAAARRVFAALGRDPVDETLRGGEDYRLLLALPAAERLARGHRVGELVAGDQVRQESGGRRQALPRPRFEHGKRA